METCDRPANDPDKRLDLDDFFPYRLSVVQQEISRSIAQVYTRNYGLMRHDWRVMAALGCDQPLSANGVAERTNMDKVQVSRAIARLRQSGLVVQEQDTEDRRRSSLRLTPEGQRIYQEIVPLVRSREDELLTAISPAELRRLDTVLGKLHRRARELARRGEQ